MTIRIFLIALFGVCLAACESVPVEEPPLPETMTEASFDTALASAKAYRNPYQADKQISAILSRPDLTTDMRAEALFARGSLRRQTGNNRRGAVQDFDEMLRLAPSHHLANNARIERGYAQTEITRIDQRLRSGRLQTIAQWFDDAWLMGDHDKAAARYQRSGLSPTQAQVKTLLDAGYLCKGSGAGGSVYKYGQRRSDLTNVNWCRAPSV